MADLGPVQIRIKKHKSEAADKAFAEIVKRIQAIPDNRKIVKCPNCHGAKPEDGVCPFCDLG